MNHYIDEQGVTYAAVESVYGSCKGCELKECEYVHCIPYNRPDQRDVIWVKSEPYSVTPVKVELTFAPTERIDAVRNTVARLRAVYEPHFTVGKTEITQRDDCTVVSIPLSVKVDKR